MRLRESTTLATFAALGALALSACGDDKGGGITPPGGEVTAAKDVQMQQLTPISVRVTWTPGENVQSQTVQLITPDGGSANAQPGSGTYASASLSPSGAIAAEQSGLAADASEADFRGVDAGVDYRASVISMGSGGESAESDTAEALSLPETPAFHNMLTDPGLPDDAFTIGSQSSPPNFIPASAPSGYTAFDVSTLSDGVFEGASSLEATDYPGAVEPGTSVQNAWYSGWTIWTEGGSDSRDHGGLPVDTLRGTITSDMTLTANTAWYLDGIVFIGEDCGTTGGVDDTGACAGDPATLTIEPGTTIVGVLGENITTGDRASELVVSRGSRIVADAQGTQCTGGSTRPTAQNVIVMTSQRAPGERARGDWGGLVLNGQAPVQGGEAQGEGDSGTFGGDDALDDSGCLRGVRVEFAGDNFTEDDQLNGIAFQGVGAGTLVDYVQIHYNQDDGTEPFGGTVAQKHIVATGIGDDSFDGTDGWQGFLQFGIAQQRGDDADQCFELSNSGESPDASPRSSAVIANVTCVGAGMDLGTGEIMLDGNSDVGLLQREGSRMRVLNTIVTGFGASGFDVEGAATAAVADNRLEGTTSAPDALRFESSILWSNVETGDADANFTDASGDGYVQGENKWFFLSGQ